MQNKSNLLAIPAPATAFAVTSGRKSEILSSKSESYGFGKKCKTNPILTVESRIQESESRRKMRLSNDGNRGKSGYAFSFAAINNI